MMPSKRVIFLLVFALFGCVAQRPTDTFAPAKSEPVLSASQGAGLIKGKYLIAKYDQGVCCAAISSHGLAFVAARGSKDIEVWRIKDRKRVDTWKGHQGEIRCLAVSHLGDRLVSSSEDRTVRVWDTQGKNQTLVLKTPGKGVEAVAISADGKWLAGSSSEKGGDVWLWQLGANQEPRSLRWPGNDAVEQLQFSPDGQRIAGTTSDGVVLLWALASGELEKRLQMGTPRDRPDRLLYAAFCSNGGLLASGGSYEMQIDFSSRRASVTGLHGSLLYLEPGKAGKMHATGSSNLVVEKAFCLPDGRHLLVTMMLEARMSPIGEGPKRVLRLVPLSTIIEGGPLRGKDEVYLQSAAPPRSIRAIAEDGSVILQESWGNLYLWELQKIPM